MKKKFFAILVAGAVFFSMLPMVAFGDTGNGSEPPNGTPQTEMGTPNSTDRKSRMVRRMYTPIPET